MRTLDVSREGRKKLDVSKFKDLEKLDCSNNDLSVLDVSENRKLNELYCYYNPNLKEIILAKGQEVKHLCKGKRTKIVYK